MKREILDWKRSGGNKTTLGRFATYYGALVNRAKLIRNIGFATIALDFTVRANAVSSSCWSTPNAEGCRRSQFRETGGFIGGLGGGTLGGILGTAACSLSFAVLTPLGGTIACSAALVAGTVGGGMGVAKAGELIGEKLIYENLFHVGE